MIDENNSNHINKDIKDNSPKQQKEQKEKAAYNHDHSGHRHRMREKYRKNGLDSFEFHEMLEYILYYSIPRADTNPLAHRLENRFGKSLSNILEADETILKGIEGISDNTVLFFKLLSDITRKYNIERASASVDMIDIRAHEEYLTAYYTGISRETLVLITLNNRMDRISTDIIHKGNVNSTPIDLNKITKIILDNNASGIIIAHNHPHGPDTPSYEDVEMTKRLFRFFGDINIRLIDHYVVAETKISSIKNILINDSLK